MKRKLQEGFQVPPAPLISQQWVNQSSLLKLTRDDSRPSGRHYVDKSGKAYISVTTLLSRMERFDMKDALEGWTKYLGDAAAKTATNKGALRGTAIHLALEQWIKREDLTPLGDNRLYQTLFSQAARAIQKHVVSFMAAELQVKSSMGFAGTADAVGYVKYGESNRIFRSVIDFKNYGRPKERHDMMQAFFQTALYSFALEETAGLITDSALIIATNESGEEAQVFFVPPEEFKLIKIMAQAEAIKKIKEIRDEAVS